MKLIISIASSFPPKKLFSTAATIMKKQKGIVAVIGTTGVGKSNLGVQLGKAINGEIVNVDSMQVYKGLDIITNKISVEEREGVPHHLMDFLETHQEYRVTQFVKDALRIVSTLKSGKPKNENQIFYSLIKEIHDRGRVPILVGGTHYYLQNLIWRNSLVVTTNEDSGNDEDDDDVDDGDCYYNDACDKVDDAKSNESDGEIPNNKDPQAIYNRLQMVDPMMANKWHWKDARRVYRSLKIYLETGKPHSQWIKEQNLQDQKIKSLRFPRTCIFWLHVDNKVLDPRLDSRVDKMIQDGLFKEIQNFRNSIKNENMRTLLVNNEIDYDRGIWNAIGYKEFDDYLSALESKTRDEKELEELKISGAESMKIATRQYARKQVRWIKNQILRKCQQQQSIINDDGNDDDAALSSSICKLYLLDAADLEKWNQNVRDMAIKIAKEFLETGIGPDPITINDHANEILSSNCDQEDGFSRLNTWKKYQCDTCKLFNADKGDDESSAVVVFNGKNEFEQHLNSKWHKSSVRLKKEIDEKWNGEMPVWLKQRKNRRVKKQNF